MIPVPAYLDQQKMTHRCGFSIAFDHTLIDGTGLSKSNWCFQEHVHVLCTLNNHAKCLNARKTEVRLPNRCKVSLWRGSRGRLQDGCGGDRQGRLEGGNRRGGGGHAYWLAVGLWKLYPNRISGLRESCREETIPGHERKSKENKYCEIALRRHFAEMIGIAKAPNTYLKVLDSMLTWIVIEVTLRTQNYCTLMFGMYRTYGKWRASAAVYIQ